MANGCACPIEQNGNENWLCRLVVSVFLSMSHLAVRAWYVSHHTSESFTICHLRSAHLFADTAHSLLVPYHTSESFTIFPLRSARLFATIPQSFTICHLRSARLFADTAHSLLVPTLVVPPPSVYRYSQPSLNAPTVLEFRTGWYR